MRGRDLARSSWTGPHHAESGVTLLELLIAVGVLGILAAIGATLVRTPDAALYARDAGQILREARFSSMSRGLPVLVDWSANEDRLLARVDDDGDCDASGGALVATAPRSEHPRAQVDVTDFVPVLWRPNGIPAFCGAGAGDAELAVTGGGTRATVALSAAGEVEVR